MSQETNDAPDRPVAHAIANHSTHEMAQIAVGLAALLMLQHEHEGHIDIHVAHLFIDVLHAIELRLSNPPQAALVDDIPF